jgi:TonB family protein
MSEVWTKWESQVVNGMFPLRRLLAATDHSGVFLTEVGSPDPVNAAIKLVPAADPTLTEATLWRWRMAATLTHPHLVRVFDSGRCQLGDTEFLFVVMEYADQNLAEILPARPLSEDEVGELMPPLLAALRFLHQENLVQGQLRPSNILVVNDQLKLATDTVHAAGEFPEGIAKTSVYDPPEARSGRISTAADVWALGVTMVESLTQRPPVALANRSSGVALPAGLSSVLVDIIQRCLSVVPERRPTIEQLQDAGGLKEELKEEPLPPGTIAYDDVSDDTLVMPAMSLAALRAAAEAGGGAPPPVAGLRASSSGAVARGSSSGPGSRNSSTAATESASMGAGRAASMGANERAASSGVSARAASSGARPSARESAANASAAGAAAAGAKASAASSSASSTRARVATPAGREPAREAVLAEAYEQDAVSQAASARSRDSRPASRTGTSGVASVSSRPGTADHWDHSESPAAQATVQHATPPSAHGPDTPQPEASTPPFSGSAQEALDRLAQDGLVRAARPASSEQDATSPAPSDSPMYAARRDSAREGWDAFAPPTSDEPKGRSPVLIAVIAVVVIGVAWGGYQFLFSSSDVAQQQDLQEASPPSSAGPPSASTTIDSAGAPPPASSAVPPPPTPAPARAPSSAATSSATAANTSSKQPRTSAGRASPSSQTQTPAPGASVGSNGSAVVHEEIPNPSRGARDTIHGHVKVVVRVSVDTSGNVVNQSLDTPGPSKYFARLASEAARKWKFAAAQGQQSRQWLLRFEFGREGVTGQAVPRS